MDTISNTDELQKNIEDIFKNENIELIDYSLDENDEYITIVYSENSLINSLFNLIRDEYVFDFQKNQDYITITISGKNKLFEDISNSFNANEEQNPYIKELVSFLNKTDYNTKVVIYFNGVYYNYAISNNKYGFALDYNNFIYDGNYYRYQTNSEENIYEIFKEINKNLSSYEKIMSKIKNIENVEIMPKNRFIPIIEKVYKKYKERDLYIVLEDNKYEIIIKTKEKTYLFPYSTRLNTNNIIPEIINMYLKSINGRYEEEINSYLGKSFYKNTTNNNSLNIYNINGQDLHSEIEYIKTVSTEIKKEDESNKNYINNIFVNSKDNSYGFVNILSLSVIILLLSILTFLATFLFIKKM